MNSNHKQNRWGVVLLVVGVFAASGVDARSSEGGESELEVEAKTIIEAIASRRAEKDWSTMAEPLEAFIRVHNELESKTLRHDLQHEVGKVLKDRKMGEARELAAEALGQINDPAGGYNHLKRMLPSRKSEEATPVELAALRAVGKLARDAAIKPLVELLRKAKDREVSKLAAVALGNYGESKSRVSVLKELVTYMQRTQPHYTPGKRTSQAARERWNILRGPLIAALNRLTGQQLSTPDDWIELYSSHKRKPKALFVDE